MARNSNNTHMIKRTRIDKYLFDRIDFRDVENNNRLRVNTPCATKTIIMIDQISKMQ